MRRLIWIGVFTSLLSLVPPSAGARELRAVCQFTEGFRALRDQLGSTVVGDCLEDARTEVASGNVLQRTTGGLLVWRPRGNWTAFTDGFRTWVTGPFGLQQRLSNERFDWEEVGAVGPIAAPAPALPPAPAPAPAAASCAGPTNDDASRAAPLTGAADGVLPAAIWSRSGDQPDRPAFLYYAFNTGANQYTYVGVGVVDDGGYKVRANVYGPDGSQVGTVLVGAHERQEIAFAYPQTGLYVLQLSNFRPAEVAFHLDLRRG